MLGLILSEDNNEHILIHVDREETLKLFTLLVHGQLDYVDVTTDPEFEEYLDERQVRLADLVRVVRQVPKDGYFVEYAIDLYYLVIIDPDVLDNF